MIYSDCPAGQRLHENVYHQVLFASQVCATQDAVHQATLTPAETVGSLPSTEQHSSCQAIAVAGSMPCSQRDGMYTDTAVNEQQVQETEAGGQLSVVAQALLQEQHNTAKEQVDPLVPAALDNVSIDNQAKHDSAEVSEQQTSSVLVDANAAAAAASDHSPVEDQVNHGCAGDETQPDLPTTALLDNEQPQEGSDREPAPTHSCPEHGTDAADKLDQTTDMHAGPAAVLTLANKQRSASSVPDSPAAASVHSQDKENSPSAASDKHTDSQNSLQSLKEQQHSKSAAAAAAVVAETFSQQPPCVRPRPRLRRQPKIDSGQDKASTPVTTALQPAVALSSAHEVMPVLGMPHTHSQTAWGGNGLHEDFSFSDQGKTAPESWLLCPSAAHLVSQQRAAWGALCFC